MRFREGQHLTMHVWARAVGMRAWSSALPIALLLIAAAVRADTPAPQTSNGSPSSQGCQWIPSKHQADLKRFDCPSNDAYIAAARTGNAEAMYDAGFDFQFASMGASRNATKAARWYREAALKGHARAMTALADMYLNGDGIPVSRSLGLHWLRRAVKLGDPSAMYELGGIMLTGGAIKRDPPRALRLLREAAAKDPELGSASAGEWVSTVTKRPEHVGQCFMTSVHKVSQRLGDYPPTGDPARDSGSAIELADGHYNVDYSQLPGIDRSRKGDRIRLCVIALPRDCPSGDTRGIEYRGQNLRTGLGWFAIDSEHLCGGA